MSDDLFFSYLRRKKAEWGGGQGLTQAEVDEGNAVLTAMNEPIVITAPQPTQPPGDIPDDYWPMLAQIESGNRPYIKAGSSSASGLYQFVRSTWLALGGQWGTDMSQAFGGLKPSIEEQLQRARAFTETNVAVLRTHGIPINKASLYAAHFFGAMTATRVIGADIGARADAIAGDAATAANPSILRGKTVGEFLTWLHGKTGEWAR